MRVRIGLSDTPREIELELGEADEFLGNLEKAIAGAHQLLKPGGVLLATVSGISQIQGAAMARQSEWKRSALRLSRVVAHPKASALKVDRNTSVTTAARLKLIPRTWVRRRSVQRSTPA